VSTTGPDGDQVVDYYAQDRSGNVWWFGREGEWLAGRDGAEAGVAMPATPRQGDGWRAAYDAGSVDQQRTVVSVDQAVTTPAGRYRPALAIDVSSPLHPGSATRAYYARGVGLVQEVATEGAYSMVDLESPPG
jgi:hypothetical protein